MINKINTIEDVKLFAFQLIYEENLSFHPDDDFADYINTETKAATYNTEQASHLNILMDKCFDVCEQSGIDIYEIMGEPLFQRMKIGMYSNVQN
jgi:hypothetical protein